MYSIIRDLIGYSGTQQGFNLDSYILQIIQVIIPMLLSFFVWSFAKIISFVVNFGSKK